MAKKSSRLWIFVVAALVAAGVLAAVKLHLPLLPTSSSGTQVAADTTLSFSPNTVTGKVGEVKTLTLVIDSGKNTVTGVEFQLSVDTSVGRIQKAAEGAFFNKPTVLANKLAGGTLHFAIGSLTPKQGSGTLVTLTVRLVKPGSTTLSFSDVKIAAVGAGSTNVSRAATGVTVIVVAP